MRRFDLMKQLSRPKEELDAFLERHTNDSDIRKLCIQQALEDGKTDEAIRLLEEGKSADCDKRGLVAEYSEWLMDLYERQGQRDKLLAELDYHNHCGAAGASICLFLWWAEKRRYGKIMGVPIFKRLNFTELPPSDKMDAAFYGWGYFYGETRHDSGADEGISRLFAVGGAGTWND